MSVLQVGGNATATTAVAARPPMANPVALMVDSANGGDESSLSVERGAKIMIVDDEPLNIKVCRKFLALAGYTNFVVTTDPSAAVGLIRDESPDLILLDIMMPGTSGLSILETIRGQQTSAHTPVI